MMKSFSNDVEVAKTFQNFFISIAKNLNIQKDETHLSKTTQDNPVLACIEKFFRHPSLVCIKRGNKFSINSPLNMKKERIFFPEIQNLNSRKASQKNDISVKILKENSNICSCNITS